MVSRLIVCLPKCISSRGCQLVNETSIPVFFIDTAILIYTFETPMKIDGSCPASA